MASAPRPLRDRIRRLAVQLERPSTTRAGIDGELGRVLRALTADQLTELDALTREYQLPAFEHLAAVLLQSRRSRAEGAAGPAPTSLAIARLREGLVRGTFAASPTARTRATVALAAHGTATDHARLLQTALDSEDPEDRRVALEALEACGDVRVLLRLAGQPSREALLTLGAALSDPSNGHDEGDREWVADALVLAWDDAEAAHQVRLAETLESIDPARLTEQLAWTLAQQPERREVLHDLIRRAGRADPGSPALALALASSDEGVAHGAARVLASRADQLDPARRAVVAEVLLDASFTADPGARRDAVGGLSQLATAASLRRVEVMVLEDPDPAVRVRGVQAPGLSEEVLRRVAEQDPVAAVRSRAASRLAAARVDRGEARPGGR